MEIELSYNLLEKYLGNYEKKTYSEYIWQCPICAENGCDRHKDNLKFNERKKILHCFADETHARSILSDIYKNEWENIKMYKNSFGVEKTCYKVNRNAQNTNNLSTEQIKKFIDYTKFCNNNLLTNDFLLENLQQMRGITNDTVKNVFLGFDLQKDIWVIPTIKYSTSENIDDMEIIGFEYRPLNFDKSGLRREKGGQTSLAMINHYEPKNEILVVVEGYLDGYLLYQYLKEQGQIEYYHIVTCSNGAQSLLGQIRFIDFSKYKKYILFIDNDETGRKTAFQILEKYPFFEDFVLPCGCKDFNEHYLKCINTQVKEGEEKNAQ